MLEGTMWETRQREPTTGQTRPAAAAAIELLMQPDSELHELDLLEELLSRPEWHARAACRGMGSEMFFPSDHVALLDARRICAGCPVRRECAEFAMSVPSLKGIWAGMSERGRARARKTGRLPASVAGGDPSDGGQLPEGEDEYRCSTVPLRPGGAWPDEE